MRKDEADAHHRCQDDQRRQQQDPAQIPQALGDQFLHEAHAHDLPSSVIETLHGVDHVVRRVGAVFKGLYHIRILGLQIGVDQLLLRMIDDIAVRIHQKAVASSADADAVDICRDVAAADIQSHPPFRSDQPDRPDHGDDPGVAALKQRDDMGRGYISVLIVSHFIRLEGCVELQVFPHISQQAVAVNQTSVPVIS